VDEKGHEMKVAGSDAAAAVAAAAAAVAATTKDVAESLAAEAEESRATGVQAAVTQGVGEGGCQQPCEAVPSPLYKSYLAEKTIVKAEYTRAQDPRSRKQLWKAAIKLPMYSVAVVPVIVRIRIIDERLIIISALDCLISPPSGKKLPAHLHFILLKGYMLRTPPADRSDGCIRRDWPHRSNQSWWNSCGLAPHYPLAKSQVSVIFA
jgi:hypothetical protein